LSLPDAPPGILLGREATHGCRRGGSARDPATHLGAWWWSRWSAFAPVFTRAGWGRFVPWGTGLGLGWEEQTLTQLLTALGLESRWRVLEHCAA
jgi:hypothetical protein